MSCDPSEAKKIQNIKNDENKTASILINRPRLSSEPSPDYKTPVGSPTQHHLFLVPSPLVTRRDRTLSAGHRATEGPAKRGTCKYFSKSKGHGFIKPSGDGDTLFMHISDIEGEYVPLLGDELSYKLSPIPPKFEKYQAVDVRIIGIDAFTGKVHHRWDDNSP